MCLYTDEPDQRIEPIVGASAMAALLSHATPAPPLHYPCINHFRQCLESQDHEVTTDCAVTCNDTRFIHKLNIFFF